MNSCVTKTSPGKHQGKKKTKVTPYLTYPGHDSSEESECQMQLKSSPQWGEWKYNVVIKDTPGEWQKGDYRECVSVNNRKCLGVGEKFDEWYIVDPSNDWYKKEEYCESLGGQLFHKLNGTKGSYFSSPKRPKGKSFNIFMMEFLPTVQSSIRFHFFKKWLFYGVWIVPCVKFAILN